MCVHSTLPVASRIAITFDSRSWVYTTPCTTTGVVAYPSASPAAWASPVDSTGTHHATPSLVTSELVIGLATSRVFCRLPPGSVQAAATAGLRRAARRAPTWPAAACLAKQLATLELALLHAAADGQARGHRQGYTGHCGPPRYATRYTHDYLPLCRTPVRCVPLLQKN